MSEKLDLETKREIAKVAMTASLGITVVSAFFLKKNKLMKQIHAGAGAALAGFSLWHHFLYQPAKKRVPAKTKSKQ